MKKLVIFGLCFLAAGCYQKNSNQIKQDAMTEIKASLDKCSEAEFCKKLVNNKQSKVPGISHENMHFCGDIFDTSKQMSIVDFNVYNQQKEVACGVVNGTSVAGNKLGRQFIYVGGFVNTVYLKPSLAEYPSKINPVVMSKALEIYQKMYQENCK